MPKKLFALKGKSNSGKSTTLIKLFKELKQKYPSATVEDIDGKPVNNPVVKKSWGEEITVILKNIVVNGESLVVGIQSYGDPLALNWIKESLEKFKQVGCDIIFCACLTKGRTKNLIKQFATSDSNDDYSVTFVSKKPATNKKDEAQCNEADAEKLIAKAGL